MSYSMFVSGSKITSQLEIEYAYEFVKKKFEELFFYSIAHERVDCISKVYRTIALNQKLIKKTFNLVHQNLR
ncbi:unnamed protein product [Lupinus luteus]